MQLHFGCPNLELWIPAEKSREVNTALVERIHTFLRKCSDSLTRLFFTDRMNPLLELAWNCVAVDESQECYESARDSLVAQFERSLDELSTEARGSTSHDKDGLQWCSAMRGPLLEVTDPQLIRRGLALPRVSLQSHCQSVGISFYRAQSVFPWTEGYMPEGPQAPALVIQLWLNVYNAPEMRNHCMQLRYLADDTPALGATVVSHNTPLESF